MRLFSPFEVSVKILYKVLSTLLAGFLFGLAVYYGLKTTDGKSVNNSTDIQNLTFAAENGSQQSPGVNVNFFGYHAQIKLIFPGTKWCGTNSLAKNSRDLGVNKNVDKCCRTHDFCPSNILPKATKFGLTNEDFIVKSHCDCDADLYQCLKKSNDIFGNLIGIAYFNILKIDCFKEEHEIVKCKKRKRGRCLEYKVDKNSKKVYQWFHNPKF